MSCWASHEVKYLFFSMGLQPRDIPNKPGMTTVGMPAKRRMETETREEELTASHL